MSMNRREFLQVMAVAAAGSSPTPSSQASSLHRAVQAGCPDIRASLGTAGDPVLPPKAMKPLTSETA